MTQNADQEQRLVPRLRFPEFEQSGAWDFKPLRALAKRRSERNAGEQIVRVLTNSAEYGVVDQKDYFDKDIATKGNLEAYFVVAEGDYVYNPRISSLAPVGPIGKNKIGTGVMSPLYTVFRFNSEVNGFYEHYFRSTHWHNYLRLVSNTGARHDRMAISNDDFIGMPLPVPDSGEQQKIGEFLSSIDVLISAEADKLAALTDHKKGLMQQLFPAEGEITPRLRFPEFRGSGEWIERPIGLACHLYQPETLATSTLKRDGQFLVYGANGIIGRHDRYNHEFSEVAVTCRGATCGEVSRTVPKSWINGNAMVVQPKGNEISKDFLFQFLKNDGLKSVVSGSAQPQITRVGFSPFLLKYPASEEQQKIVDCLSAMDALIAAEKDKLETLREYKNSLLQLVFPSPNETGA